MVTTSIRMITFTYFAKFIMHWSHFSVPADCFFDVYFLHLNVKLKLMSDRSTKFQVAIWCCFLFIFFVVVVVGSHCPPWWRKAQRQCRKACDGRHHLCKIWGQGTSWYPIAWSTWVQGATVLFTFADMITAELDSCTL